MENKEARFILTIDLDVLAKDIARYNKYVLDVEELSNEAIWQVLTQRKFKEEPPLDFCSYVPEAMDILLRILKHNEDVAELFYIIDHHEVIDVLDSKYDNIVYNIDFHHDMGYTYYVGDNDLDCGNWVNKAWDKGLIKQYNWVNRASSSFPECKYLPYDNMEIRGITPENMPFFHEIYIVRSPEYLHEKIYNEFVRCYNELNLKNKIELQYELK